jgi:hypothetical protein
VVYPGSTFQEWKEDGSLLWVCGNRACLQPLSVLMTINSLPNFDDHVLAGAGKSILWYVDYHLLLGWGILIVGQVPPLSRTSKRREMPSRR